MEKQINTVKRRFRALLLSCVMATVGLMATVSAAIAQCSPPSTFSFTDVTGSAVTLNWTASPSPVVSYEVNTRDSLTATWVMANAAISGAATTYRIGKDVALSPNKTYQVRIRTKCSGSTSAWVYAGYVRTTSTPTCGLPFNLSTTDVTSVGVTFNWESSVTNLTSYEARYRVLGGSWFTTGVLPAQTTYSKRITTLTAGQTYEWVVNGICTNGDRVTVSGANFTTPTAPACSAPTNLTVDRITNVGANFNWSPTTGTASYRIYAKSASATTWSLIGSPVGDSTTYRFYDFAANTTYSWYMQSICSNGDKPATKYYGSDFTTSNIAYCTSPTSPSVTELADTGATLNWVADMSATVKYYEVELRQGSATGTILSISFKKVLSLRASNLLPNTTYYWKVRTHCTNSDRQPWVVGGTFTTNCQSPTVFSTSNITGRGANLHWNTVPAQNFRVRFKPDTSSTWTTYALSASDSSFRVSDLHLNTTYQWQVQAVCLSGNTNPWRNAGSFTTLATPYCSEPSGLTVGSVAANSAVLSWTPASLVALYTLAIRNTSSVSNAWVEINISGGLSNYTYNSLASGVTYEWRMKNECTNGDQNSDWVNGSSFTTTCASPSGLDTSSVTGTGATFNWAIDNTNISKFEVQIKTVAATSWTNVSTNLAKTALNIRTSTLSPSTSYVWRIRSTCTNGTVNDWVQSNTFTTKATFACSQPSSLEVSEITSRGADLLWVGGTSISTFDIEYKTVAATSWTRISNISGATTSRRLTTLNPLTTYMWRIRSICSNADVSPWVDGANFTTNADVACQSPTSLNTTALTANGVTLNWSIDTTGLGSLQVSYKLSSTSTWSTAVSVAKGVNSYRLSTLSSNSTYNWQIRSVCSNGDVQAYVTGNTFTTTNVAACNSPSGLSVSDTTSNGATLNWSLDTTGLRSIQLSYKTSAATTWGTAVTLAKGTTSYRLNTLTAVTSYVWRVRTVCGNNDVTDWVTSNDFSTTAEYACQSPTNLTTNALTANGATLSWSLDTAGLGSVQVSYKLSSATAWGTNITLPKATTSYRLSTLVANTSYDWRLRSVCSNGDMRAYVTGSTFATTNVAACNSPSALSVSDTTSTGATLNWSLDTTGLKNIQISYKTSAATTWGTAVTLAKSATNYRLSALTALTSYVWRVRTVCGNNDVTDWVTGSSFSTSAAAACQSPTNLNTSSLTSVGATLNWSLDTTGLKNIQISYKTSASTTWGTAVTLAKGTTSYRLSTLTANTSYDWRLRTVCSNGDIQAYVTGTSFSTTNVNACNSPTSLNTTSLTSSGVTLGWAIDTTGLKNIQLYYKLSSSSTWSSAITIAKAATSYRLTGLVASTAYDWRLRSVCSNADIQSYVTGTSFTTTNAAACNSPASLTATSISAAGATLGWTIDTTGLKNMQLYYKLSSSATWSSVVTIAKAATSYRLTGLVASTAYDWRIRSVCSNGDVQSFVTGSFTTTNTFACSQPSSLTTSNITTSAVKFNWTGGTGISTYDIQFKTVAATTWSNAVLNLSGSAVSYTKTALATGTTYMWRMRSKCTNTDINPWVDGSNFTTLAARLGDESFAENWTETVDMFPNPSNGLVNIGVETAQELPIDITVLNALGQQVVNRNVTFTNDNNTTEFNLSALPAGMYFVKMKSAQKVITRQLILENR